MIATLTMIRFFKIKKLISRTEEDRAREQLYGISVHDVAGYLEGYKKPLQPPPDYPRSALNTEANWIKTKELIQLGEIGRWEDTGRKLAHKMRFDGGFRLFLGLLLVLGGIFLAFEPRNWGWRAGMVFGIYMLGIGIIRGWYLVYLIRKYYGQEGA